jgi:hypothetical protein
MWPGRVDTPAAQSSWYLGSHAAYGLYVNTGLYVSGLTWATAFYDHNNTAFYADPAGTSVFSGLSVGALTSTGTTALGGNVTSFLSGNWELSTGGLGGGAPHFKPQTDNSGSLGTNTQRWNLIRGVTITSGDLQFENGWTITESYKVGIAEPGLAILDEDENLVMFIPKLGQNHARPYVRTTKTDRARMLTAEQRKAGVKGAQPLSVPDPKRAKVGGR